MTNPQKKRCAAENVDGSPCRKWAMAGVSYCSTHMRLSRFDSKLTPEVQTRIVQLVRLGNYVKTACTAAGISESTYHDWMRRGDPAIAYRQANAPYREFRHEVERARAEGEAAMVMIVGNEARARSWQAATWFLERAFPERWSRPSQREEVSSTDAEKDAEFDEFKEYDELARARRDRLSGA